MFLARAERRLASKGIGGVALRFLDRGGDCTTSTTGLSADRTQYLLYSAERRRRRAMQRSDDRRSR